MHVVLARFGAAHHELATEEFLVVQFLHCAFRFIDRLHGHEGEPLGALVVAIADDLGVLHVADTVKQLEEIALRRVERQIADVQTRRSDFDRFYFTRRTRRLGAIARRLGRSLLSALAVSCEKRRQSLPECFLRSFRGRALMARTIAPSSGSAARVPRTSPG